ncbi:MULTISPECIES: hypothetical protein [Erwinia]|nr:MULTISPECIES: hypothetical protein [Erwinia]NNS08762.1 hypothetical protein [Erwinia sp. JH02]UDQ80371.1 hypothetical protein LJN55_00425 [Erwinia rhapontici]
MLKLAPDLTPDEQPLLFVMQTWPVVHTIRPGRSEKMIGLYIIPELSRM